MSSSISGTVTAHSPAVFCLNMNAPSMRQLDKEITTQRSDELARQRAAKRKAQHDVEMLAIEWSKVMLEKTIYAALDPATDPALAAKLRNTVLDRGIGRVKTQEDDEVAKQAKSGSVEGFLEALAAISAVQSALERTPPAQRLERDITASGTDLEAERFLSDLDGYAEVGDE
jgi:hypothetical protein